MHHDEYKAGFSSHHTCLTCRKTEPRSSAALSQHSRWHAHPGRARKKISATSSNIFPCQGSNEQRHAKKRTSAGPGNVLPCQGSRAASQNSPSWPSVHLGVHQKMPQFFGHPLSHGFSVPSYWKVSKYRLYSSSSSVLTALGSPVTASCIM